MKKPLLKSLLFCLLLFLVSFSIPPETRTVSGRVIAFDDLFPVEGVTVLVKGTTKRTGTQVDGTFYVNITAPEDSVLIFSAPHFENAELKLSKKNDYDVILKRSYK